MDEHAFQLLGFKQSGRPKSYDQKWLCRVQGGPLPIITGVITPISRVISPQLPIYRGYNSINIW